MFECYLVAHIDIQYTYCNNCVTHSSIPLMWKTVKCDLAEPPIDKDIISSVARIRQMHHFKILQLRKKRNETKAQTYFRWIGVRLVSDDDI